MIKKEISYCSECFIERPYSIILQKSFVFKKKKFAVRVTLHKNDIINAQIVNQ